jgi:predicted dehydrogenase
VVGAGHIAGAYADVVEGTDEFEVVAVADLVPEAAAALARRMGCAAYHHVEQVIELEPDIVVLCTPPSTHPALAQRCFDRGVAVFCEKPLAVDGHAAAAMAAAAADAGVQLGMATKFRSCADVERACALIANGRIGALRHVEVAFTSQVDMTNRWNSDPAVSGGGVIIDNGTHAVDLVRLVAGPITEVLAVEHTRPTALAVEDSATLHLRTVDGVDATIDLSWAVDKSLPMFLRLYGADGEVRVGWRESAWRRHGADWHDLGSGYAKVSAMGGALRAFCRQLRSAPTATPADAVAAADVIDACYASIRCGGWVKIAGRP